MDPQADIRNLGIIATELAHIDPPTFGNSSSADFSVPTLSSMYSIHFTNFVISCLEKAEDKVQLRLYEHYSYPASVH